VQYKTTAIGLLSTIPGIDGRRDKVLSALINDRRLLITLGIQLFCTMMVSWA